MGADGKCIKCAENSRIVSENGMKCVKVLGKNKNFDKFLEKKFDSVNGNRSISNGGGIIKISNLFIVVLLLLCGFWLELLFNTI